ncbi:MAG: hypothetical protein HOY69_26225 [Streptomyces sp.]|nr:hypothetical protein [Streptomyces sp.]
MPLQGAQAGRDAELRGEIAERTLMDMLSWWLTNSRAPSVSRLVPDSQKVDLRVILPSLWQGSESCQLDWQVKTTTTLSVLDPSPVGCPALKLSMKRRDLEGLYEFSRGSTSLMLALGVQSTARQRAADLLLMSPLERFEWWALDLNQYFSRVDWRRHSEAVFIPVQNKLNLATFSLLWSSRWVGQYFSSLSTADLLAVPDLQRMIPEFFHADRVLEYVRSRNWSTLGRDLQRYEGELDLTTYRKLKFQTGLAVGLGVIRDRMYDAADCLDVVRNYCPESLYGTANLWLFSSCYHQFMKTSGDIGLGRPGFRSQRLLPLPEERIEDAPLLLLCALWHVLLVYQRLGTKVHLVQQPAVDAGADYSYYGGGIGYYPWFTLTGSQADWVIDVGSARALGDNLDFINSRERETWIGPGQSLADVAGVFGVPREQMQLPDRCPRFLFPRESIFLRYPAELFQGT